MRVLLSIIISMSLLSINYNPRLDSKYKKRMFSNNDNSSYNSSILFDEDSKSQSFKEEYYTNEELSLSNNQNYLTNINDYYEEKYFDYKGPTLFLSESFGDYSEAKISLSRTEDTYEGNNSNDTLLRAYDLTEGSLNSPITYTDNITANIGYYGDEDYFKCMVYVDSLIAVTLTRPTTYDYDLNLYMYQNTSYVYYGMTIPVGTKNISGNEVRYLIYTATPGHYVFSIHSPSHSYNSNMSYGIYYCIIPKPHGDFDLQSFKNAYPNGYAIWDADFKIAGMEPKFKPHSVDEITIATFGNIHSGYNYNYNELINEYFDTKATKPDCYDYYGFTMQRVIYIWSQSYKNDLYEELLGVYNGMPPYVEIDNTITAIKNVYERIQQILTYKSIIKNILTGTFNIIKEGPSTIINLLIDLMFEILINSFHPYALFKNLLANFISFLSVAKENSNIIEISISPKLTIYQGFEYHLEYCFLNSENDPLKNIQFHTFDPTRFAGNKIKDYLNYGEIVAPYSYGKLHLGTDLTLITDLLGFSLPSGGTTPSHC